MLIETRVLGKRPRALDNWSIPFPPDFGQLGDGGLTLRELITHIVRHEVGAFRERENTRRFVRVLSDRDIGDGAARGKIDSGGRSPTGEVNDDAAVGAALQGFEDGLYLVIVDGVEQRDLDCQVFVNSETRIVFLRLTLPFADDDPRTAEVLSKVLLLARDKEIRDPNILEWIRATKRGGVSLSDAQISAAEDI